MAQGFSRTAAAQSDGAGFQTTHWSVVLAAGTGEGTKTREALARLCETYWYPLYAFIRRQGSSPHEAEDLTQEFFYRFLERNAVEKAQPSAGKFRSFLLVCLKHFMVNERAAASAQRRGGGLAAVPLETGESETRYLLEPVDNLTPEALFERRWAFAVLDATMAELRREYSAAGKGDLFQDLQGFLPNGRGTISRADLASKRGVSPGAIDVALHRLRHRFGALLRQQVACTVSSEAEIEDEIRYLISIIGA